ncbi:hypothetical protein FA13DRAFT_678056 [Coprinellus micaceus]|uniref:Uncharacterized protein n=1 Tax=Coprinellus micaceus TaxID=71717 RepID=A0A4Y7S9J8_COPMI|nr:hypothetical protein FA13DRAFT_678056 [Coprinellus micaceus]
MGSAVGCFSVEREQHYADDYQFHWCLSVDDPLLLSTESGVSESTLRTCHSTRSHIRIMAGVFIPLGLRC